MKVLCLALLAVAGFSTSAFGATSIPGVVSECETVYVVGSNGQCIGATQSFLNTLKGGTPATNDEIISNLIVELVPLIEEDDSCTEFDSEVAQAIDLAASASNDRDQAARLTEIADTVRDCNTAATAALRRSAVSTSPG